MSLSKKGNEISPAESPDMEILPIPFNITAKQVQCPDKHSKKYLDKGRGNI